MVETINASKLKEVSLNNIGFFINKLFLQEGFSENSSRLLLDKILKNRIILTEQLLFFYTSSNIVNIESVPEKYFFKLLFTFLEKETLLTKEEINILHSSYINRLKDKFSNSVCNILSNSNKKKIGIENLKEIEKKIKNREQSEIILSFLEKHPQYIKSTVLLILGISDINKIIELIININEYDNIVKLTDDNFNFEQTKDNTISKLNLIDIHYAIHLLEHIGIFKKIIIIINEINILHLIKMLNILGPYEVTNLINIIPNIIIFINYINKYNIDDIIEKIKNKGVAEFVKNI